MMMIEIVFCCALGVGVYLITDGLAKLVVHYMREKRLKEFEEKRIEVFHGECPFKVIETYDDQQIYGTWGGMDWGTKEMCGAGYLMMRSIKYVSADGKIKIGKLVTIEEKK